MPEYLDNQAILQAMPRNGRRPSRRREIRMAALGLRGKSLLALLLTCLLALMIAGVIGHQVLDGMQSRFGEAYARNLVQLNRERMFAPVARELALAQRLAGSQLTLAWLRDEQHPQWRELFFREAASFQQSFDGQLYFAASAQSHHYYGNGPSQPPSLAPRYTGICQALEGFATLCCIKKYHFNAL